MLVWLTSQFRMVNQFNSNTTYFTGQLSWFVFFLNILQQSNVAIENPLYIVAGIINDQCVIFQQVMFDLQVASDSQWIQKGVSENVVYPCISPNGYLNGDTDENSMDLEQHHFQTNPDLPRCFFSQELFITLPQFCRPQLIRRKFINHPHSMALFHMFSICFPYVSQSPTTMFSEEVTLPLLVASLPIGATIPTPMEGQLWNRGSTWSTRPLWMVISCYFMLFPLWETMVSHSLGINVYIRLRRCGKLMVFPLDDDLQIPPTFDDGLQGALVAVVHLAPKIERGWKAEDHMRQISSKYHL